MAATVTHRGTTWNTTAGNKTVVATPAVGDLIVVIAAATGFATTAVSDTQSGSYVQVDSNRTGFSTTGTLNAWVRTALIPAATSTTWTATQTSSTGGGLTVISVSGMTLLGAAAVRASGGQSTGTAATTPAPVLSLTPLSSNPIITAIANGTSPATITPRSGYTEDTDLGYATPTAGLEVAHLASGETSATLTHGSTSATAFASIALEIQYNSSPTVALNVPADTGTVTTTTPQLTFTGTDANSDAVTYEVEIDTANTFDSGAAGGVTTYYFDGHISVTDPNSVWTNDANAYDGNTATTASTSSYNASSPPVAAYLYGKGTNTPSSGGDITQVRARIYGGVDVAGSVLAGYITTSAAEALGTASLGHAVGTVAAPAWSTYVTLTTPAAGWSWATLQALEVKVWQQQTTGTANAVAARVDLEVTYSALPLIDKLSASDTGFADITNGSHTNPFPSGENIGYTTTSLSSGTYYWRVRGKDPSGTNVFGAWSGTRSFTVNVPPGTPTLSSPADTATVTTATPQLQWSDTDADGDAISYEVQVDAASSFDSAPISRRQSQDTYSTGTTSVTATFPATPKENNLLIAVVYANAGTGGNPTTVPAGWSQAVTNGNVGSDAYIYYKIAGSSEPAAVTFGQTAASAMAMATYEYSGTATSLVLDKVASSANASSTSDPSGTTAATTQAKELVFAAAVNGVGLTYSSVSNSYTVIKTGTANIFTAELLVSTTGTQNTTFTTTTAGSSTGLIATFKAGAPLLDRFSSADTGFTDITNGAHTDPFTSGETIGYTTTALTNSTTYYWRVRGKDPSGSNTYGAWATTRSFTVSTSSVLTKTQPAVANIVYNIAALTDDFNDNATAAFWNNSNTTQVKEQNQRLELSTTLGGGYYNYQTAGRYLITASGVYSQLVNAGNQALVSLQVFPVQVTSGSSNAKWIISGGNAIPTYDLGLGAGDVSAASVTHVNNTYYRVRESGGTLFWDYSSDATTWTNQYSRANPLTTNFVTVALQVGTYAAEASTSTIFIDNLNVAAAATVTKTQPATARIATSRTLTQGALARVAKNITKTQPGVARVAVTSTKTQPAISRIAVVRTLTQPAISRVARTLTKTQTATARIANSGLVRTQPAIARISATRSLTQTAVSRIANTRTKVQTATANITTNPSKAQPAVARIARNLTRTQPGISRISITGTKTQPALGRVSNTRVTTQLVVARVARIFTKAQPATARIANTGIVKTQPAISRISNTRALTQPAIARVAANKTRTITATARIANTGVARVQSAKARIATKRALTQTASARIAQRTSRTQPAISRLSITASRTQPAIARLAKARSATISATASVLSINIVSRSITASAHIYQTATIAHISTVPFSLPSPTTVTLTAPTVSTITGRAPTVSSLTFQAPHSSTIPVTLPAVTTIAFTAPPVSSLTTILNGVTTL